MDTVNVRERGLFKTCIRGYGRTKTCIPYDDTFFGLVSYILVSRIACVITVMINVIGIVPVYILTEFFDGRDKYLIFGGIFSVLSSLFVGCSVIWWVCVVALDYQKREMDRMRQGFTSGLGENTMGREWELGWAIYAGMACIFGFVVQSVLFFKFYFDGKTDDENFGGVNVYEPYRRATVANLERDKHENDKSSSYC